MTTAATYKIVDYKPGWSGEFLEIREALRRCLGGLALRIDHIGSTAVPGLAAKDILDIQITVRELDAAVEAALEQAGYERLRHITQDHVPPGAIAETAEWTKWMFKPRQPERAVNVHVRVQGHANQRYALLFRDYLRDFAPVAQAYGQVKQALVAHHLDDPEAYYDVKDPVCDIIMGGAEMWAAAGKWKLGPSDC